MAKLKDKVFFAYNEGNILRLGAQLLLGVQLQETLDAGFNELPVLSQWLHAGATVMLLLMMPATYHRYVEQCEATERFHRFTSLVLLWSMIPFGLGMCGNLFIVLFKVSGSLIAASCSEAAINIFLYWLWFGYMIRRRRRLNRHAGWFLSFRAE